MITIIPLQLKKSVDLIYENLLYFYIIFILYLSECHQRQTRPIMGLDLRL